MSKYVNLHCHSHGSLLDGLSRPEQIAELTSKHGYVAAGLTDHGNLSQCVKFMQECKARGVKPILGCELYLSPLNATIKDNNNRKLSHLPVLAKNLAGWRTLIKIVSRSNDPDVFYYKPRLDLKALAEMLDGNIIAFSGHPGSDIANCMFLDNSAYSDHPKLRPDAVEVATNVALRYQDMFGKGNFWLEKQLIDHTNLPVVHMIGDVIDEVSKRTGIPKIATGDSHYPERKDAIDQRVLLCSSLKTTFKKVNRDLANGEEVGLGGFFKSNNYHIPSYEDMIANHSEEELRNTVEIADMCENYDILSKPKKPHFICPDGMSEFDYLRKLGADGWAQKLLQRGIIDTEDAARTYQNRLDQEYAVIKKADLAGYFLVVQDYVNWAKNKGWLIGPGRGSAAGSLVSYLTNITSIDPIPHDLLFSRFYNEGRNTADHISLPDIDIDVPTERRDDIINYLREKYGHENVCQIGTFGRLQAKAVIREVLRVHEACPSEIINRISKQFPDEARVADKMQADNETSLIMWTLKYEPEKVGDYCYLRDDGQLAGEYANYFEQAIRLEGTFKSQGKHAAGVIVADEPISNFIPMVRATKGEEKVTGFEMNDSEAVGGMKLDILGNAALDKLMYVNVLLRGDYDKQN